MTSMVLMKTQANNVFDRCDFIMGKNNNSIVIIVPAQLPKDDALTLKLQGKNLVFYSGDESFAEVEVIRDDIMMRLSEHQQVGMIETDDGKPTFPAYITAVANIKIEDDKELI